MMPYKMDGKILDLQPNVVFIYSLSFEKAEECIHGLKNVKKSQIEINIVSKCLLELQCC